MVGSRTLTAAVGVVGSLLVSATAWYYFDSLLVFLFVPFVPLLFRRFAADDRPPVKECPDCGYRTRDPAFEHCPRDGRRLE
jgi:hypothetical protein